MSNGYFQLVCKNNEVKLRLVPPTEDGGKIEISEVIGYLQQKSIPYDLSALNNAIQNLEDPTVIKLVDGEGHLERECCKIEISQDKMLVTARFYAPCEGGELMSKEEFMNDLAHKNIVPHRHRQYPRLKVIYHRTDKYLQKDAL